MSYRSGFEDMLGKIEDEITDIKIAAQLVFDKSKTLEDLLNQDEYDTELALDLISDIKEESKVIVNDLAKMWEEI